MLKTFIQKFKRTITHNEEGSVLSVALIVITILAFSVSTITNLSINLAGQTNIKLESVNNEITGKALIDQAISEFQQYVRDNDADYTTFNNVEVPRILSDYNVIVTDVTTAEGITDPNSKAYKFAYTYQNASNIDQTIFKISYASLSEIATVPLNPFDYEIGSNGDILIAGGYYDAVNIFGKSVYLTDSAPYVEAPYPIDFTGSQDITPAVTGSRPILTTASGATTIFENYGYQYCSGVSCFTTNGSNNPFVIRNETIDVFRDASTSGWDTGQTTNTNILNFFGDYDYNDFVVDIVVNDAPSSSRVLPGNVVWSNLEASITDPSNMAEVTATFKNNGNLDKLNWPNNADFYDITNVEQYINYAQDFSQGQKKYSMVYNGVVGDATKFSIDSGINIGATESLIVIDDFVLNSTSNNASINGLIIVFGDLYIEGNTKDFEGSIIVFGETFINFNDGEGIKTSGNNYGFTVMAKDNIHVISHYESHNTSATAVEIDVFFYTEESLFIDAVNSRWNMTGALFARGKGLSGNDIFLNDESLNPFRGIVINSYYGYINGSGAAVTGSGDGSHRFQITTISQATYQDRFDNIPVFEALIQQPSTQPFFYTTDFDKE